MSLSPNLALRYRINELLPTHSDLLDRQEMKWTNDESLAKLESANKLNLMAHDHQLRKLINPIE